MDDPSELAAEMISRRQTMINREMITIAASNPTFHPPPAQQSFYRKYIASAAHVQSGNTQQTVQNADLSEIFASLDPSTIVACLHNAITMQSRMAGNR